jgi:hypothetical protein
VNKNQPKRMGRGRKEKKGRACSNLGRDYQGWALFEDPALRALRCRSEIFSAARFSAACFSAAGVLALQRFTAAALCFAAAELRCRAKKHKRCSGKAQRCMKHKRCSTALQRCRSVLQNSVKND